MLQPIVRLVLLAALVTSAQNAWAVDVTTCGQTLAPGEHGMLVADLDCPQIGSEVEVAVGLARGARLSLNGFTLSGGDIGVQCFGPCKVEGPGNIEGFALGIIGGQTLKVENLTVSNTGQSAIQGFRVRLEDVSVLGSSGVALAIESLRAERVVVDQCLYGFIGLRGNARDLSVTNCSQRGLSGGTFRGERVTVTDNGSIGVWFDRVGLRDSVVTGNDAGGSGVDIRSSHRPRLKDTVCERSDHPDTGLPHGVCSLD